jgi:Xaa-Pro dipeptidase
MQETTAYSRVPRAEIEERWQRFGDTLAKEGFDAALLVQKADVFYFAGTVQQAHLLLSPSAPPLLLVRRSLDRAKQDSPLEHVESLGSFRGLPERVRVHLGTTPKRIGLELDVLPVNLYYRYARLFGGSELEDVSRIVRGARMIKSEYELGKIGLASDVLGRVMSSVPDLLGEGQTEETLSRELAYIAMKEGHEGYVRVRAWDAEFSMGTVVSGPHGAVPGAFDGPVSGLGLGASKPGGASHRPIRRGEPVLVDMVTCQQGYLADQTRVFCLGSLPDRLAKAHWFCVRVLDRLQREGLPGREAGDLYRLAMGMAEQEGWEPHFMGTGKAKVSFVGHGLGLELDEWPVLARGSPLRLEEGMVVAVEPKVVLPGKGAVGVEDTCVVTSRGLEPLTRGEREVVER